MRGFDLKKAKKFKDDSGLGLINGDGTGTSDSIKANVPSGSYIMPADSTQQLGAQNLKGLGFSGKSTPINVSNGEYGLPPEQVHAVGVQTLDQMKNGTHAAPVGGQNKPDMFFADGGLVDDEQKEPRGRRSSSRVTGNGFTMQQPQNPAKPATSPMQALDRLRSPPQPAKPAMSPMQALDRLRNPPQPASGVTGNGFTMQQPQNPAKPAMSPMQSLDRLRNPPQPNAPQPAPSPNSGVNARGLVPSTAQPAPPSQPPMRDVTGQTSNAQQSARPTPSSTSTPSSQRATSAPRNPAIGQQTTTITNSPPSGSNTGSPSGGAAGGKPPKSFFPKGKMAGLGVGGLLAATGFDVADTPTEQYRERFGMGDYNPNDSGGVRVAKDLGTRTLGAASDLGNAMTLGLAGMFYRDRQDGGVGATDAAAPEEFMPQQPQQPQPIQQPQQPQQPQGFDNNIVRDGNSFSGKNISSGYTINGQNANYATTNPNADSVQNQQARQNLLDRTPDIGGSSGALGLLAYQQQQVNETNQNLAAAARQSGQVNAAQSANAGRYEDRIAAQNEMRMIDGGKYTPQGAKGMTASVQARRDNLANSMTANSASNMANANNTAAADRQMAADAAATQRAAMTESGLNSRFNTTAQNEMTRFGVTSDLDERKFGSEQQIRGFQINQLQRQQALYEKYDAAATPEEKAAIAAEIRAATGGEQANRYTVVAGGQEWDEKAGATLNRPAQVLNNQTGEFVNQGQSNAGASASDTSRFKKGQTYRNEQGVFYWDGTNMMPVQQ